MDITGNAKISPSTDTRARQGIMGRDSLSAVKIVVAWLVAPHRVCLPARR